MEPTLSPLWVCDYCDLKHFQTYLVERERPLANDPAYKGLNLVGTFHYALCEECREGSD